MREPATSCTTCGAALLPAEVFYTSSGEVACAACWTDHGTTTRPGSAGGAGPPGGRPLVQTARERRTSVLRWTLLFAILAATSFHVRQIALTELRMVCPRVWIDAPGPAAAVPAHFIVRGRVATDTITRPLWVVARPDGDDAGIELLPRPIVADMFGDFAAPVDLLGHVGQRYRIFVISADELANGWLESASAFLPHGRYDHAGYHHASVECPFAAREEAGRGMTVLSSVGIILAPPTP